MKALAFLALALPAGALEIEKETYKILGWNDACVAAVERLAYPKPGQAIYEPISTRVGIIGIEPGKTASETVWNLESDGTRTWNETQVREVERELAEAGYDRPGYPETIRPDPPVDVRGVRDVILSTATLKPRLASAWPSPPWRWAAAHYNPLTTCALLIFEMTDNRTRYLFKMTRIANPRARIDRARAHVANALLLFDGGDLDGALAEARTASLLAPEDGSAHYHHARTLALTGNIDDAMRELKAAADLDKKWAERARDERDLEPLRTRVDFEALVSPN